METVFLKVITILFVLKYIKTAMYADYADYNDQNVPNNGYDHEHADDQSNRLTDTDGLISNRLNNALKEHTMVTESNVFPYMVTILKGTKYISSGALIDENWVLTTADGLFLMRESVRLLRVRLGSINYKKGGIVMPIKLVEIHPYFDDKRPNFDLALLMLAMPVRYTPHMKAIRLQLLPREVTATHFIVTSWPGPLSKSENSSHVQSMEMIKRQRILTVTHLHPAEPEECAEELREIGASTEAIMCLDPALKDPCLRDVGAPVVLNHILWSVISSWKPENCNDTSVGPVFANLVSARNVSTWIHATVHGHPWNEALETTLSATPSSANFVVRRVRTDVY